MGPPTRSTTTDHVAHLFRRAGFGALPSELTTAAAAGYDATVSALVAGLASPDSAADAIAAPTLSIPVPIAERRSMDPASGRHSPMQLHEEFLELTTWWLGRMLVTSNPLNEKLTFLLHNQFPTAISKVRYPQYMYAQNQLFRTQGSGDFDATDTGRGAPDPAMLIWLDAKSEQGGEPERELRPRAHGALHHGRRHLQPGRRPCRVVLLHRLARRSKTGAFEIQARQHCTAPQKFLGMHEVSSGQQVIDIVTQSATSSQVRAVSGSGAIWPIR